MPGSDMTRATMPIPINYTRSCYSFSDSGKPKKRYLFDLVLNIKNRLIKKFSKIEKKQHSQIITTDDNINYNDITSFKFNFAEIPFDDEKEFYLEGVIDHKYSSFTVNTDKFYIEFSQSYSGKTICEIYVLDENFDVLLSVSPN